MRIGIQQKLLLQFTGSFGRYFTMEEKSLSWKKHAVLCRYFLKLSLAAGWRFHLSPGAEDTCLIFSRLSFLSDIKEIFKSNLIWRPDVPQMFRKKSFALWNGGHRHQTTLSVKNFLHRVTCPVFVVSHERVWFYLTSSYTYFTGRWHLLSPLARDQRFLDKVCHRNR